MSRDWQTLEEIKRYDDSYWLRYLAENTIFDTENIKAQKKWLIKQLEAEKGRAEKAEASEQKLREGIEEALRDATKWENPYEGYNDLQKLLDSLYPKEETK
jgi:CRISPR/Cas system CSM-associated protein Csm2 small subunit